MSHEHQLRNKVLNGWWDGQPIWRNKTAEEILQENKIKPEVAHLYIALKENYENK